MRPLRSPALPLLVTLAGVALSVPFWVGRLVPLLDLPQHLAVVTVLRHHGDPDWGFARFFDTEWGELTPYWTYYLAVWALSFVCSVETASRVYLTLYALAVPWAGVALCRGFGRSPWLGLLAAPVALGANLYYGFVSYCTGVVLTLWLLGWFEGDLGRRAREGGASAFSLPMAILTGVLFFTHVQAFVFYVAVSGLLALTRTELHWRSRLASLLPLVPATAGLLGPWLYLELLASRLGVQGRYNFGRLGRMGAVFARPDEAVMGLPDAIAGVFQDGSDTALFAVWVGLLAAAFVAARRGHGRRPGLRAFLPALVALAGYFGMPVSITGQWNIGPRFAALAAILLLAAAPARGRRARGLAVAAVVLTMVVGANAALKHRAFDVEAGAFDEAIAAIPRGVAVTPLIFDARGAVLELWPYLHIGQYVMVRRGGATSHTLAKPGPFPIRLRDVSALPQVDPFRPGDFRYEVMGPAYDCFFVRGPAVWAEVLFPAGAVELVFSRGPWHVYRNASRSSRIDGHEAASVESPFH